MIESLNAEYSSLVASLGRREGKHVADSVRCPDPAYIQPRLREVQFLSRAERLGDGRRSRHGCGLIRAARAGGHLSGHDSLSDKNAHEMYIRSKRGNRELR